MTKPETRNGLVAIAILAFAGLAVADRMPYVPFASRESISISLAGCMDRNGDNVVRQMARDVHSSFADPTARTQNFMWVRGRALQSAAMAEEMRRCYLEAQSENPNFDSAGLISDDMRKVEGGVAVVYEGVAAALAPGQAAPSQAERADNIAAYRVATDAMTRISIRLGTIVEDAYF